jgi:hypothetical protein
MNEQTTDFQRGVEAMRRAAMDACMLEARHARSHGADPRYAGREDGAEACALEISFLDVKDEDQTP